MRRFAENIGMIEIILTVCAVAQPSQCEEQHLQFASSISLQQCTMAAPPYIAKWIDDHPKWTAVRWRCDYPGKREI
jgi:hypothetical protein